jgi:hypothetical protein
MSVSNVEIIVARYNEDLKWMLESPFNEYQYTIYNKGLNNNFNKNNVKKIINLPNIGRCDHTYLYHIIENYNSLSNITVFFPGSIDNPGKIEKAKSILNIIKNNNYEKAGFVGHYNKNILNKFESFCIDYHPASDSRNYHLNRETKLKKSILRPFNKWYLYHFGNLNVKFYSYNGIFSIHKNDIIQHDISRYKKLIYGLSLHSNPEVGHYCERAWGAIFHPFNYTKVLLI